MKLSLPDLMIFDMDGLIFNSEELFMNMKTVVMKDYGYMTHRKEDYIQTLGLAGTKLTDKLLELYGPDYPATEISQKTRARVTEHIAEHGIEVKAGIHELLDWLKAKQIPCCVASSSPTTSVNSNLARAGLTSYFSFVIGGDQISNSKPNPEIFLRACEIAGVAPADALVLEDSENGILAAYNGEIPVICIPDMKYPSPEFEAMTTALVKQADEVIGLF